MLASVHRALPQDEEAQGDGQEGREHRRGVGPDRATVAGKRTTWRLMARPPRGDKRHPVEAAYGGTHPGPDGPEGEAGDRRWLGSLVSCSQTLERGRTGIGLSWGIEVGDRVQPPTPTSPTFS